MSSPKVLTPEEVAGLRPSHDDYGRELAAVCDSHEALRREVARLTEEARKRTLELDRLGRAFDAQVARTERLTEDRERIEASTRRSTLDEAIAEVQAWSFHNGTKRKWQPNQVRDEIADLLERLRDMPPEAVTAAHVDATKLLTPDLSSHACFCPCGCDGRRISPSKPTCMACEVRPSCIAVREALDAARREDAATRTGEE